MTEIQKIPYIGVSGIVNAEQQAELETCADDLGLYDTGRKLALGVKATHKTQYMDTENKYGADWYPVGEAGISDALTPSEGSLRVAQAYLDINYVGDEDYRREFMQRLRSRGAKWLQAVQFDMLPWHSNSDMWRFIDEVKDTGLEVLLQVHKHAMEDLGPRDTMLALGRHAHLLDYVLFDSSHGTGKRLNVESLRPFVYAAYSELNTNFTGIAIAGGLNSHNVRNDLPQLVSEYPNISWDAEGQLHPVNENGRRPLDMQTTSHYLDASIRILLQNA